MTSDAGFDSLDLDSEEFRELGYRAVDIITEYFAEIDDYPVFPGKLQSEIEAEFEDTLPEKGQDPEAILEEWPSPSPGASGRT